jgi:hypothetical protein
MSGDSVISAERSYRERREKRGKNRQWFSRLSRLSRLKKMLAAPHFFTAPPAMGECFSGAGNCGAACLFTRLRL